MCCVKSHRCGIKALLRMLGHDHEIELVGFGRGNQLGKVSRAMPSQRTMNVNDALVIDKLAFAWRPNSLCIELLNRISETPEAVTTIGKRKLGYDDESQKGDKDLALHKWSADISAGGFAERSSLRTHAPQ